MSVSVDLVLTVTDTVVGDGESVWSGRLPELPAPGDLLDLGTSGVGTGPLVRVLPDPNGWRLTAPTPAGMTTRDHDVASVLVLVEAADDGWPV